LNNIALYKKQPDLMGELAARERLAKGSKMQRLLYTPARYILAMFFRHIIYPLIKKEYKLWTTLFWGEEIHIALPASTDIFLLGCKTDDPEIRLTKYLIKNLRPADFFLDIGSHVGYYSLLSSLCVGEGGKVMAIEASPASFELLKKNVSKHKNIEAFNLALSDKEETVSFFEFPGYAEYNTMIPEQFEDKDWYKKGKYHKTRVAAMTGDKLMSDYPETATIIKIDVEGAESRVVAGLTDYLSKNDSVVVMEFVNIKRHNSHHVIADAILLTLGYTACHILPDGELKKLDGPTDKYIEQTGLESDNIVYQKNFA
jgi:FkbM family methyltransferase